MMHDLLRQVNAARCSSVDHMKTTDALVIATQVAVNLTSLIWNYSKQAVRILSMR